MCLVGGLCMSVLCVSVLCVSVLCVYLRMCVVHKSHPVYIVM